MRDLIEKVFHKIDEFAMLAAGIVCMAIEIGIILFIVLIPVLAIIVLFG